MLTVKLKRTKQDGTIKIVKLYGDVRLHMDLIDKYYKKCLGFGIIKDINEIIDSIIESY